MIMKDQEKFKPLREELKMVEATLRRLEGREKFHRIDVDVLLDHVRKLYEKSLDLKNEHNEQLVTEAKSSVPPVNEPRKQEGTTEVPVSKDRKTASEKPPAEENEKTNAETKQESQESNDDQAVDQKVNGKVDQEKNEEVTADTGTEQTVAEEEQTKPDVQGYNSEDEADLNERAEEKEPEQQEVNEEKVQEENGKEEAEEQEIKSGTEAPVTEESVLEQAEKTGESRQAIYEKFKGRKTSLHDKLQEKAKGKAIADKLKLTPVSDLRYAIGLNEKAVFIKELFRGDKQSFKETLDKLNNAGSYAEAVDYLDSTIKHHYQWDEDSQSVEKFMELIYRRFLK